MSRNLKALGPALVAVFAMSAVVASAAQAKEEGEVLSQKNTATAETGFLFGSDENESNPIGFTAFGSIECEVNQFEGGLVDGTDTSLTVTTVFGGAPGAQKCISGGFPATVDNNGCHLLLDTFETGEPLKGTTWKATTDLTCPEGKPGVQVTAWSGGGHSFLVCTITLPPQNNLQGVTIHNNANTPSAAHDLTFTADITAITAHKSGLCGTETTAAAEMSGEVTMTAKNKAAEPIDLYIRHEDEPPLKGNEILSQRNTTTIEPSLVTATDANETNKLLFTWFGGETKCAVNEFHGELATGTATALTVETEFGGPLPTQNCTAAGFPMTVDNNGCHLLFKTFETAPPLLSTTWKALTDLHCPVGSPGVQVTMFSGVGHKTLVCTITVPPQTDLQGVTAHNQALTPGKAHDLTLTVGVKNITAHRTGLCGESKTAVAEMHGEVTATAKNASGEPIDLYIRHHE